MDNPFNEKDSKKTIGSARLDKYDEGIAARMNKQIKGKPRDSDGSPDWGKIQDTHHSVKDNKRG